MAARWLLVIWMIMALAAYGCGSDDSDTTDGDVADGDVTDGDTDGDVEDGDADGDTTDGDADGDVIDGDADGDDDAPNWPDAPPDSLPFEFTREAKGQPLSEEEIAEFTRTITGMWKDTGYFDWVWWTSHGLHPSYDPQMHDYKLWWQDTQASKTGDTITFSHTGGADNLTLRTCKVLNNAAAGYLMSGDERLGEITESYCKGLVALSLAMEFSEDDPVKYLQARAIFTHNHSYELEGGRKVTVDYDPVKHPVESWNAHTLEVPNNPNYGDIWIRNMRSKDDVPHMFRSVPMLMRLAEDAQDENVKMACTEALEYMKGFANDIVDSGYYIRTKYGDGEAVIPTNEDGIILDLGSFNQYDLIDENAECTGKIGAALIAKGDDEGLDCGEADWNMYEDLATTRHYYNYAIVRFFHIAAVTNALMAGSYETAQTLLAGLAKRADRLMANEEEPLEHSEWYSDLGPFLLASATAGLPLTDEEARLIMEQYTITATHYGAWDKWDPWNDAVPDGAFNYKPDRNGPSDPDDPESAQVTSVRPTEIAYLLEYCYSPFINPAGARVVDCDIVRNPSRWGE